MGSMDWVLWLVVGGVVLVGAWIFVVKPTIKAASPFIIEGVAGELKEELRDPKKRSMVINKMMEREGISRDEAIKKLKEGERQITKIAKSTYARPTAAYTMRYY